MDPSAISELDHGTDAPAEPARRSFVSYRTVEPIAILLDIAVVVAACAIWSLLSVGASGGAGLLTLGIAPVVCAVFIPTARLANFYHPSTFLSDNAATHNVALLWGATVAVLGVGLAMLEPKTLLQTEAGISFALVGLFGLLANRASWRLLARNGFKSRNTSGRRAVLIQQGNFSSYLPAVPDLQRYGISIEHRLNLGPLDDDPALVRQRIEMAIALAQRSDADEVLIAADVRHWQDLKPHLARLRQLPLPVSLIARDWLADFVRRPAHILGSSILVEVQRPPLNFLQRMIKRITDIALAAIGLTLLWPLLAIIALMIRLDSPGPVLFRQTRIGFNGRAFRIYKFRTMTVLEDGPVVRQATCEDDRITAFGRWLRRTSIDELPQLFNVLMGDMSIVGPRPHAVSHDMEFGRLIADYAYRRQMKPGITGWAQVSGCRGATPEVDLMARRIQLDMLYIENWSVWLDFGIIARTVFAVLRGHNAY
jgi:putative colanic acid biosynthesis UDP-glucose lipid carrier transferase